MSRQKRESDDDYAPTKKARSAPQRTVGISYCQPSEAPGELEPPTYRQPAESIRNEVLHRLVRQVLTDLSSTIVGLVDDHELSSYLLMPNERQSICRQVLEGIRTLNDLERHRQVKKRFVLHFQCHHGSIRAASTLETADLLLVIWTYQGTAKNTNNYRLCVEVYVNEKETRLDPLANALATEAEKLLTVAFPTSRISELRTAYSVELLAHRRALLPSGVLETEWFMPVQPVNFTKYGSFVEGYGYPIGVKCYENIFTEQQILRLEQHVRHLMAQPKSTFQYPNTRQDTEANDRIKFFFDARYLFGEEKYDQNDGTSGIRVDVEPSPAWLQGEVEEPLIAAGLVRAVGSTSTHLSCPQRFHPTGSTFVPLTST